MTPLTEKYRPQTLAEIVGQPDVVEQLTLWLADPYPVAFLFEGETGTGKTSAALALAAGLGVDVEQGEFGGLYQIASGEQTGETVRTIMAQMRMRPWSGSGWRVLVVNEADAMTPGAAVIWLDALEKLPQETVVVFTTNSAGRIPARLRDRCERLRFESGWLMLLPFLQEFVDRVWAAEVGDGPAPDVQDFGPLTDEKANVSVRRLLQLMQPWVRAKKKPSGERKTAAPVRNPVPCVNVVTPTSAKPAGGLDWAALGRRYLAGESSTKLAHECDVPETTLRGGLNRRGFRRPARSRQGVRT